MRPRPDRAKGLIVVVLAGTASLLFLATCPAQGPGAPGGGPSRGPVSHPTYGAGNGGSLQAAAPEPYGGQIFCPVSGNKLGLKQPAEEVHTSLGEQKPTFLAKIFGEKPTPGAVIYVCCPECAEKVKRNPERYLQEVIADKAFFTYPYAKAPAQRPARAGHE